MKTRSLIFILSSTLTFLMLSSCNIYDPLDSPSDDAQYLSAARACFDDGDLNCAREMYGKLASTDDTRISEETFLILEQMGVGMGVFMQTAGSGAGAAGFNSMANYLAPGSPAKRVTLQNAFKRLGGIKMVELRGLVRFITAFTLASEILAEAAGANNVIDKTDLVADTNNCTDAACATNNNNANCAAPAGNALSSTGSAIDLNTSDLSVTTPTTYMLNAAINAVSYALNYELNASGRFNQAGSNTVGQLLGVYDAGLTCYRRLLIKVGIGG